MEVVVPRLYVVMRLVARMRSEQALRHRWILAQGLAPTMQWDMLEQLCDFDKHQSVKYRDALLAAAGSRGQGERGQGQVWAGTGPGSSSTPEAAQVATTVEGGRCSEEGGSDFVDLS